MQSQVFGLTRARWGIGREVYDGIVPGWKLPAALQPKPPNYNVRSRPGSLVGLRLSSRVPADAFTTEILGTQGAGNGS